jgi:hypothetical protein
MLKDLDDLKKEAIRLVNGNMSKELVFTPDIRIQITKEFNAKLPGYSAKLSDSVLLIENGDAQPQSAYLPFQWFARIHHCRDLISALDEYVPYVSALKNDLNDDSLMRDLPKVNWESVLNPAKAAKIRLFINNTFAHQGDKDFFSAFLDGRTWMYIKTEPDVLGGRKLNRVPKDYIVSSISNITRLINDTAGKLDQFIELYRSSILVRSLISSLISSEITAPAKTSVKGENIIYYGAPGTGKSHAIDMEIKEAYAIRTVFHADTQNSDFMGCLKPLMDSGSIKYEFRPGPFTNAVIKAVNNPNHHHWLVIEEINRAHAAAVFGEIFQLLDRASGTGMSRYDITLSDLDMQAYIIDQSASALVDGKLRIPANLSLLATMNSSDQAVMPLDTAFKRRWNFRYIPLDFDTPFNGSGKACATGSLKIIDKAGIEEQISWRDFATAINIILTESGIPEDRHLGPFFVSDEELDGDKSKEVLTGKLFMYLWDDVLRHGMKETVFNSEIRTYGQLTRNFINGEPVFSNKFYDLVESSLEEVASNVTELEAVGNDSVVAEEVASDAPKE